MATQTVNIDFDAVHCDWRHMTATGKGWGRLLRDLGGSEENVAMLVERLKKGMAAEIELQRIYRLAGR